jgi:5-methylthioadenosine/S-adenosylhomocysteine deaminase
MLEGQSKLVARARFLLPVEPEDGASHRIKDGYLLTEAGKIIETGSWNDAVAARVVPMVERGEARVLGALQGEGGSSGPARGPVPCLPGILLPGFVKAHGHDHESPIMGVARDEPLTDWLDHAVNAFAGFVEEERAALEKTLGLSPYLVSYRKARLDDITYGITTSLVHHCNFNKYHVDEIVAANREAGTRIQLALGSQDRHHDERILDSVDEALARLDRWQAAYGGEPRFSLMPGPDQFFSNGPEMLKALKAWAEREGTRIHIHSSEEPRTTNWFRSTFGKTPVEYGRSVGFLDQTTMLAHQVNCTDEDLEIIAGSGAAVVHNPLANTILGSGMPPVVRMLEMRIPLAISTDGSGSADNQNMIAAARLASQYQKAFHRDASLLPAHQLLPLITRGPARMLGIKAGALRTGFDADFILVDTRGPNMTPTRLDNCLENLFWAANGSEIRYVVADGRILVDDYSYVPMPVAQITDPIQEISERFIAWREKATEIRATGARTRRRKS